MGSGIKAAAFCYCSSLDRGEEGSRSAWDDLAVGEEEEGVACLRARAHADSQL